MEPQPMLVVKYWDWHKGRGEELDAGVREKQAGMKSAPLIALLSGGGCV